ncbi:hypothetical protein PHYPSEUDO_009745 [Phytophthora pseudosyringae]|uniref:Uncharacterized protein n=1 Tax=Phytophthora pseudosyringae TaxID=221518 RepID=A0A8T1VCM6_9STRA|nr:hypothetical protein PHYPSEUDO_009745 [Phytophthora pseudosyringae]
MSITSLYADVNTFGPDDYTSSSAMKLTGGSALNVDIFGPTGCSIDETTTSFLTSVLSTTLGTGIDLDVKMWLDIYTSLTLKPHESNITFGSTTTTKTFSAGSVDSDQFFAANMTSSTAQDLAQTGIDIDLDIRLIPKVHVELSLLNGTARVGVRTQFSIFAELQTNIKFPSLYPGLWSRNLNSSSLFNGGDYSESHFMEYFYNGYAGYRDVLVTFPTDLNMSSNVTNPSYPYLGSPDPVRTSLISGCVASADVVVIKLAVSPYWAFALDNEETQKSLTRAVMWALDMPEIDTTFASIDYNSFYSTVKMKIAIPPSIADNYSTHSLQLDLVQKTTTETFSEAVTAFVGVPITAQCNDDWWEPTCSFECSSYSLNCEHSSCSSADGTKYCLSCADGNWE